MSTPVPYGYDVPREQAPTLRAAPAAATWNIAEGAHPIRKRRVLLWALWLGLGLALAIMAALLFVFLIVPIGIGTSLVAATAALVPFTIVLTAIWWLDRYTPQPRASLAYSFVWGAIGSVALALAFGFAAQFLIVTHTPDPTSQQFLSVAIQAPVVEESVKAAGLLVLLLFGRRYISGPIDGVIYAALIATGFAFTENILYFSNAFAQSQADGTTSAFLQTFLVRGLMSPCAHASFTSLVGLGLGIAAERRSITLYVLLGFGGLGGAMLLHCLWNGGSSLISLTSGESVGTLLFWYALVEVPIFVVLGLIFTGLRFRESRIARARLTEYHEAGWLTATEVDMLVGLGNRRRAYLWASAYGAVAGRAMREFTTIALRLAAHRQAALAGNTSTRIRKSEAELLAELTNARRTLSALTRPVGPAPRPAHASE